MEYGVATMSPRATEVHALLLTGATTREIARHLRLQETTIKCYVTDVLDHVGAKTVRAMLGREIARLREMLE